MPFQKSLTLLSLYVSRRLSRHRPLTILTFYLFFALSLIALICSLTTHLLLTPLASYLFRFHSLPSSPLAPSQSLPSLQTYTLGATRSPLHHPPINYASLPLRRPEADLIISYLQPHHNYLEFGASGTTLTFPSLVNQTYTIEHDGHVCDGIASEMRLHEATLGQKLRAFCAPVSVGKAGWGVESRFEEGSYRAFGSYVDVVRANLSEVVFDRVLINGRARVACALRVLRQLREESLLFFHDWFVRPTHYAMVLGYYDEIARVLVDGEGGGGWGDDPMGLVVLKPKKEFVGVDVSIERVNEIYDEYIEREPKAGNGKLEKAIEGGLKATGEGGIDYYGILEELKGKTSKARVLLDVIMIPFVWITIWLLKGLFRAVILDALTAGGVGKGKGPVREGLGLVAWIREGRKAVGKLPVVSVQKKDVVAATGGKAE